MEFRIELKIELKMELNFRLTVNVKIKIKFSRIIDSTGTFRKISRESKIRINSNDPVCTGMYLDIYPGMNSLFDFEFCFQTISCISRTNKKD